MLMGLWLDQPKWLMLVLLVAFFFGISLGIVALGHFNAVRPAFSRSVEGVVPTFFSSICILLALLTGFVANDAWERQRQGSRIVEKESANLIAAYDLSIETISDMHGLRRALLAYTDAVVTDEWPRMADGGASSPTAGAALSSFMRIVADPALTGEAGAVAHSALMTIAMTLREARGERLSLSGAKQNDSKWLTLIFLAVLTLVSIGIAHVEKPRAQTVTLALFSSAMVVTLYVIALHERPFDGPLAIPPTGIERVRAVMLAHQAAETGAPAPAAAER